MHVGVWLIDRHYACRICSRFLWVLRQHSLATFVFQQQSQSASTEWIQSTGSA